MLRYAFRIFAGTYRKYCGLFALGSGLFRNCFGLFRICTATVSVLYRHRGPDCGTVPLCAEMFQRKLTETRRSWAGKPRPKGRRPSRAGPASGIPQGNLGARANRDHGTPGHGKVHGGSKIAPPHPACTYGRHRWEGRRLPAPRTTGCGLHRRESLGCRTFLL
jgi:hypothetical protein